MAKLFEQFGHTSIAQRNKQRYPEGTKIKINHLSGEDSRYDGKFGTVEMVDDMGQLHGTWGGLAILPDEDDFTVIS